MMQPAELSPLTALAGSDIRLEDALRSSCTFLLWERLYGVATVFPTADKISLYCLQQRQKNPVTDSSAELHQKDRLLQRPQVGKSEKKTAHDASVLKNEREVCSTLSRDESGHFSSEALPWRRKEAHSEGNSIVALGDYRREAKNTTAKSECQPSLREGKTCKYFHVAEFDDQPLLSFPPPPSLPLSSPLSIPVAGRGCPSTTSDVFLSQTPYRAVAEETTLTFYEANAGEDNVIERHRDPSAVSVELCSPRSPASDVLNLGDDINNNNGGNDLSDPHAGGGRSGSGVVCHPQPDPASLTRSPTSQGPRWGTSIEPRRIIDEELLDETLGDKNDGSEEELTFSEGVPVPSDGQRAVVYSDGLPASQSARDVPLSFCPQPKLGTVSNETPVGKKSDETTIGMTTAAELNVGDEPERKTRRYCPPAFYSTRITDLAESVMDKHEVGCHAPERGNTSSPRRKSLEKVSAVVSAETAVHVDLDGTMTPRPSQGQASSAFTKRSLSPSFLEDLQGNESEVRCSPEMNVATDNHVDDHVTFSVSLDEGRKDASPCKSPQEPVSGHHYQPLEETRIFPSLSEADEKLLSVSPSPSFKDYEWAAKAQEALEQQQKRFCARTPSTNPSSPPPPLQVGGFELPQLPRGRHPTIPAPSIAEGDITSAESPQSASKMHRSLRAIPDGATLLTDESATQPPTKPVSKTAPFTRQAASSQGQLSGTPKTAAVTRKRSRQAALSPSSTEEFPLPRTMAASESTSRKRKTPKRTKK